MATVFHQIQYWTHTLAPGDTFWLSYGPDDRYKNGTVQVTCCVNDVGIQERPLTVTQTLSVPELFITTNTTRSGDLDYVGYHVGFNVTNRGQHTIKFFSVAITVIGP